MAKALLFLWLALWVSAPLVQAQTLLGTYRYYCVDGQQTFTAPANTSYIVVKVWGGGGGGGYAGGVGGGAGYISAKTAMSGGQSITVSVGGGGRYSSGNPSTYPTYDGGAGIHMPYNGGGGTWVVGNSGQGGGYSVIYAPDGSFCIVGGGGGAGDSNWAGGATVHGGGGGGPGAYNGGAGQGPGGGGVVGGGPGNNGETNFQNGGGGGGWSGGGAGQGGMCGGAGGTSGVYANGTWTVLDSQGGGSSTVMDAGRSSDPEAQAGGYGNGGWPGSNGTNGLIVVYAYSNIPAPTVAYSNSLGRTSMYVGETNTITETFSPGTGDAMKYTIMGVNKAVPGAYTAWGWDPPYGNGYVNYASDAHNPYTYAFTPTAGGSYLFTGFCYTNLYSPSQWYRPNNGYTINVANRPTTAISASATSINFGQSTTITGTYSVDTANGDWITYTVLASNSFVLPQSGGSQGGPGWGGAGYSYYFSWFTDARNGNANTVIPAAAGTATFYPCIYTNFVTAWANWSNASVAVTVNKATPSGTFANGTKTPQSLANYTVQAGDLNATFANPYSGAVAAPSGAISYTIAPTSLNGVPGTAIIPGTSVLSGGLTYVIRATIAGDSNYVTNYVDSTWTVSKGNQSAVSVSSPAGATYGTSYSATATGGNGTGAYVWTLGAGSTATGAAINSSTGVVTALSSGTVVVNVYKAGDTNFNQSGNSGNFTITFGQRTLTVSLAGSKVYDGTTGWTGTLINSSPVNLAAGDSVTNITTSSANAGTYAAAANVVVKNASSVDVTSSYAIGYANSYTITQATQSAVTITSANSTTYGNAYAVTSSGGLGTGSMVYALGTGSTASGAAVNASTGAVTALSSGTVVVKAMRNSDTNYLASAWTADFPVTIAQRPITVTLSGSKPFDGTTTPTGASATITVGTLAGADSIGYAYANCSSSNVGTYSGLTTATILNASVPNTRTGSYTITYAGTFTIGKQNQTITFNNPGNRNYSTYPQAFALTATSTSGLSVAFSVTSGSATIAGSTITVTAPGAITVQATQAGDTNYNAATAVNQTFSTTQVWNLTVAAGTGGTAGTSGSFADGTSQPLSATPNATYRFVNWTGATGITSTTSASTTILMNANKSVTANFIKTYTLTVSAGVGGTAGTSGTVDSGTNPAITATPSAGYRFDKWTGTDAGLVANVNAASTTISATKDLSVTANFIKTYTLTVTSNVGGTPAGAGVYDTGSTATPSVTVGGGYLFAGWNGTNAASLSDRNANPTSIVMNGDYTVNANVIASASVVDEGTIDVGSANIASSGGNKNSQRDVTLTNTGNAAVNITNYVMDSSASSGEFTLVASPTGAMAGGAAVTATINFHPTNVTGTRTATLLLSSDDPFKAVRLFHLTAQAINASQTITFPQPADKIYGDAPFALTATASSGLAVTYSIVSGPATVSGSTITLTGSGTVTVRASQAGNGSWAAAPDVDRTFNVAKATITVTLTGSKIADGTVTATGASASITAGSLAAGDTIGFAFANTSSSAVGSYSGLTTATISNASAPLNRTSSYTITYAGNYTISKASPTITFPAVTDTYVGQSKALTASLSGGSSPTGSITYSILSTTGGANGTISPATQFNATALTTGNPGTVTIRATYAGDAANNSTFADRVVNIPDREPAAASGGAVAAITFGNSVSVPVSLTDPDANCNGYTVQIYNPTTGWGAVTPYAIANTASQSISFGHTPTGAGTWQYRFAATDASGVTGTTQYTVSVVVNKASTTTTASYSDASAVANRFPSDVFTITASTKSDVTLAVAGTPTYTVQSLTNLTGSSLTVGAAVTSPFSPGGTATRPSAVVDHGEGDAFATITILVSFAGDANYLASSTTVSFTVVNSTYATDLRARAYPTDPNLNAWLLPSAVTQNNYTLQRTR